MAKFKVLAEKLWHSTDCKVYAKGDVVELPDNTKVGEGSSVEVFKEPTKPKPTKGEDLA